MTPAELAKAIADNAIPPIAYLYGGEPLLLNRAYEQLRDHVLPPAARDFNLQLFHGRETRARDLLEAVRTLPVFAPRRLVVVRDADAVPAAELEQLIPYIEHPYEETLLVFLSSKIDARRKIFQKLKKRNALVEFKPLSEQQLPGFVRREADRLGLRFTTEGLAAFCRRTDGNLYEIVGTLHTMQNYLGDDTLVDRREVELLVPDSHRESVFRLTDSIGRGQRKEALLLLRQLLDEGEPPLRLLTMIVRHFRQLWKLQEARQQRLPRNQWAGHVGLNPYFLNGLASQADHWRIVEFPGLFELFVSTDLRLKSSGAHADAILEQLVAELAGMGEQSQRGG